MNRKIFFYFFYFLFQLGLSAQTNTIQTRIDSLRFMTGNPYDCNAMTWKIVAEKKNAISFLIEKLGDTTVTRARTACKNAALRVGDLAYICLSQIIELPFAAVTGMQCDVFENNCQLGKFEYIESNRNKFKSQVQKYYSLHQKSMKWTNYQAGDIDSCLLKKGINGYYQMN